MPLTAETSLQVVETFYWLFDFNTRMIRWNVTEVHRFLDKFKPTPISLTPEACRKLMSLGDGEAYADGAASQHSLEVPIILIEHPSSFPAEFSQWPFLCIDGWHRLAQAVHAGVGLLAYPPLTRQLEEGFRIEDTVYLGPVDASVISWEDYLAVMAAYQEFCSRS